MSSLDPHLRSRLLPWLGLAVSIFVLSGSPCIGKVSAQQDTATAYRQTVAEALAEFDAQNYLESRALFLRAHKLQPNARTLRGLGAVAFELRRYAESASYLDAALTATEKPLTEAMRAETDRLRQRALGFVAQLDLTLAPARMSALVDGELVTSSKGSKHRQLWLDIGSHTLAFEADGYLSEQRSYTVAGGEHDRWTVTLKRLSESEQPASDRSAALGLQTGEPRPTKSPIDVASRSSRRSKRRLLAGSVLAAVGIVGLGLGGFRLHAHIEDGLEVRTRGAQDVGAQNRWLDSRALPLILAGASAGVLTTSSALVAGLVPRRTRRWLSPSLLAVGAGALATGLLLVLRSERCEPAAGESLRGCVLEGERRDRGIFVSLVALPLLTIPVLHAVDWLRGR